MPVDAVVSCAFGSPYEGEVAPAEVAALGARLADAGAGGPDLRRHHRHGHPPPGGRAGRRRSGAVDGVGLHLHDTRGTALVNAYAALALGVTRFDTAVGGLGGSPFAHGAGGNLATEELVALLDDLGVHTGIDVEALADAALLVEGLVGRPGAQRGGPRRAPRPAGPDLLSARLAPHPPGGAGCRRAVVRGLRPLLQAGVPGPRRHLRAVRARSSPAPTTSPTRTRAAHKRAPWHFYLLIIALVVYLGWRLVQGIAWVAHRYF